MSLRASLMALLLLPWSACGRIGFDPARPSAAEDAAAGDVAGDVPSNDSMRDAPPDATPDAPPRDAGTDIAADSSQADAEADTAADTRLDASTFPEAAVDTGPVGLSFPRDLRVNGGAVVTGNQLVLTDDAQELEGSAYLSQALTLTPQTAFSARFSIRMFSARPAPGDGMAFILQSTASGTAALGTRGAGLGYGGLAPSVAVEFDTAPNQFELDRPHVGITANGSPGNHVAAVPMPAAFYSGATVWCWVDYDPNTKRLSISADTAEQKPAVPLASATIDLPATLGPMAFVGFTAGTGARMCRHEVLSFELMTAP